MTNEIDWEGEARDWLLVRGHDLGIARFLALFLKETAEIHADQRTEEIAKKIEAAGMIAHQDESPTSAVMRTGLRAAAIARSFIQKKRTREDVLEEALRAIEAGCPPGWKNTDPRDTSLTRDGGERAAAVARRALAWKDTDRHP